MSFLLRQRYYCINDSGGCHYCINDVPFTPDQARENGGRCRGREPAGCREFLVEGDPEDLRFLWATACLVFGLFVLGTAWVVRTWIFPPPLEHVAFDPAEVHAEDSVGLVRVTVVRSGDLNSRIQVRYASEDGSAKADEDYESVQNTVIFEPGENRKAIPVRLLPDPTLRKEPRYFTLTLLNVEQLPRGTVYIEPRRSDQTAEKLAEQAIKLASATALDVADNMIKLDQVSNILAHPTLLTPVLTRKYQEQRDSIQGNLTRSRESYLQQLGNLQGFRAPLVMHALDEVHAFLASSGHDQQAQAVERIRSHFAQFQQTHNVDMDRWAQDLKGIIPRAHPSPAVPAVTASGTST